MLNIRRLVILLVMVTGTARAQMPMAIKTTRGPEARAAATLVVYNLRDPESVELAGYYLKARKIPAANLLAVDAPTTEEISRDDYEKTLAEPLRKAFSANGWWRLGKNLHGDPEVAENKIRFIALMRGVPLKIAPVPMTPEQIPPGSPALVGHNEASVDSELATLGFFSKQTPGALQNPYYEKFATIEDARLPMLMLVCRLDGPSMATVKRMIDDALAAEAHGLWGIGYADARGITTGGYAEGDQWIAKAAAEMMKAGFPVIYDNGPDTFPAHYPMRLAALYYGWYAGDANGPFLDPDFKFQRGAVAVHIHSFSASTVRDPKRAWVGPLLDHGAAATMGNVYEPYLTLTPHLDVFEDRLRNGFSFAESGYMCERVLSWMTTFVGDPLYTPFPPAGDVDDPTAASWKAYRDGARLWQEQGRAAGEKALNAAARARKSGLIYEGLGLLQASARDPKAATASFEKARAFYANPADAIRTAVHEINLLGAAGDKPGALALARKVAAKYPKIPATDVVRGIINQLAPPPPTPTPSASPKKPGA